MVTAKSSTSSTTLAHRPWKRGTVTPPAASTEKRPSSDSGWLARSPLALTSPVAAPAASSDPVADSVSLREAICPRARSLSSAASLRSVRSPPKRMLLVILAAPPSSALRKSSFGNSTARSSSPVAALPRPATTSVAPSLATRTSLSVHASSKRQVAAPDSATWAVISSDGRPSAVTLLTVPRHPSLMPSRSLFTVRSTVELPASGDAGEVRERRQVRQRHRDLGVAGLTGRTDRSRRLSPRRAPIRYRGTGR